jgi:hypothetical protein
MKHSTNDHNGHTKGIFSKTLQPIRQAFSKTFSWVPKIEKKNNKFKMKLTKNKLKKPKSERQSVDLCYNFKKAT